MFKIASNRISFLLLQKGECVNTELQKDQLYSLKVYYHFPLNIQLKYKDI